MKILVGKISSLFSIEPATVDASVLQTRTARADRFVLIIMPLLLYVFFFSAPFAKVIAGPVYVSYCLLYGVHLYLRPDKNFIQEPRVYYILLLLYIIIAALSLSYTPDFLNGLKTLKTHVGFVLIPVLIETVSSRVRARQYIYLYAFGGTVLALMIIYQGLVLDSGRPGALWHPVHGAHLITYAAVVSLALFISAEGIRRKWVPFFLFVILSIALYLNGTRGAWVALGAVLFVAPFLMIELNLYRKLLYFAISMLLVVLVLYSPHGQKRFIDSINDAKLYQASQMGVSVGARLELWRASSMMFRENPILGVGIGGWQKEFGSLIVQEKMPVSLSHINQTHNIYLDVLSTRGIIGLLTFMLILVYPMLYAWRKKDKRNELFRNIIIFASIVFMVAGLTDTLTLIRWSFLSYIALSGVGLSLLVRNAASE